MGFIDANGDGINDLIQDSDGDGVPNRKDPDWTRPAGPGKGARGGQGKVRVRAAGNEVQGSKFREVSLMFEI